MSADLAAMFREHVKSADAQCRALDEIEQRLQVVLEGCRVAWPGLGVSEHAFIRQLAERLPDDGDLDGCLARIHAADLYLACGCVAGDPAALATFDSQILSQTVPVLQRMRLSEAQIDEVLQVVRTRLLVHNEGGPPPLATSYAARGPLLGWVRTTARRTALSLRRNLDEQIVGVDDDHGLDEMPLPADAELDYLKNRYQLAFKQALEAALATLDPEQLRTLRLHYHDGLSIDRIGALLGVHRATAARWIRTATEAVRDETRRVLHARLGLSAAELDSLGRLVQSQLHLSLGRLLSRL